MINDKLEQLIDKKISFVRAMALFRTEEIGDQMVTYNIYPENICLLLDYVLRGSGSIVSLRVQGQGLTQSFNGWTDIEVAEIDNSIKVVGNGFDDEHFETNSQSVDYSQDEE